MNTQVIGKCSRCGDLVTLPYIWSGVTPPRASCSRCHAIQTNEGLPTIPMSKPAIPLFTETEPTNKWVSGKHIKSTY